MADVSTQIERETAVARAGSTTRFCFGDDEARLGDDAWYEKNAGNSNQPVGQKKPNDWNIRDMHGSAWEWCHD